MRLAGHYVIPHISTGDIFRSALRSGTELGNKLKDILDAGNLVPDEITVAVVAERLDQDNLRHHGFILDGFPRTIQQAEALSKLLAPDDIDLAIDLELPTELAVARLAGRRVCRDCQTIYGPAQPPRFEGVCDYCGGEVMHRADDNEESIRRRLDIYTKETEPIITWYLERDMLVTVDGTGDPDDVTSRLIRSIDRRKERNSVG